MDPYDDFQRNAVDETAIVPLEFGTVEANEKHISQVAHRDYEFDGEDFRTVGGLDGSTYRVPGGIEANEMHPGITNHRDYGKFGDLDFQSGGTADHLITRKKEYGEDEGLDPAEFDFRVAAVKELEETSETVNVKSVGWNSSTRTPQGKLVMDQRNHSKTSSPAGRLFQSPRRGVGSAAKKKPAGWSMAMIDAQRKSGATPTKPATKKAAQKENKKGGLSSSTSTPLKRGATPKKTKDSPSTPSGGNLGTVWKKVNATETVQAYWYNAETRETSWTPPKKGKKKKKKSKPSSRLAQSTNGAGAGAGNDFE